MAYSGKDFEKNFFDGWDISIHDVYLLRLYDTTNGFRGVANPCDFIMASRIGTTLIELKTTKEASLPFSNVTDYQWTSLLEASEKTGTQAGILVYFQKHDQVIWYPIHQLAALKELGVKSINPQRYPNLGKIVKVRKKRVHLDMDIYEFLNAVEEQMEEELNEKET